MNCKPGDLAIVVKAHKHAEHTVGAIVSVTTRFGMLGEWPAWNYKGVLRDKLGRRITALEDVCLRPIRDNPGEDETLTWAGKPEKVSA